MNFIDKTLKSLQVNCKYGAPMGRASFCENEAAKVHLGRVTLIDGGYDLGGAYWGTPSNLYMATDKDHSFRQFVRAKNRDAAKAEMKEQFPDISFYC